MDNTATQTAPADAVLVERAREGDFDAFDQLVTRHERRLYSLAMGILRQAEDAEDAVQTSFISALEHLDSFRGDAAFGTWVTRILTNTALKIRRKRQGLPMVSLDEATEADGEGEIPHPEYIADWSVSPTRLVEQRELNDQLRLAMDALPESYRLVFLLRDVHELSVKETAAALGISPANVKVRLLRARLALREKLTRLFGDDAKRLQRPNDHGDDVHSHPAADLLRKYQRQYEGSP